MYEFNKKQKIIIAIILCSIIIAFLYYIYTKDDATFISGEDTVEENNIENEEEKTKETEEENHKIVVHVSGAVNKEGVFELEENSRISDAIHQAEGLKENADTKNMNLAFKLEDGMKIYIPTIEENKEKTKEDENHLDETSKYVTSSSGVVQDSEQSEGEIIEKSGEKNQTAKVNINTANQTELETLPGIGPSTSLKIINYRKENGKFKEIEDIKEVSGIGDAKYENIKDLICVK